MKRSLHPFLQTSRHFTVIPAKERHPVLDTGRESRILNRFQLGLVGGGLIA